jgi:hypothetical protein
MFGILTNHASLVECFSILKFLLRTIPQEYGWVFVLQGREFVGGHTWQRR